MASHKNSQSCKSAKALFRFCEICAMFFELLGPITQHAHGLFNKKNAVAGENIYSLRLITDFISDMLNNVG